MTTDQPAYSPQNASLLRLIHADQLDVVRKSTLNSIPVTTVLSILCALVASYAGQISDALPWLGAYTAINLIRINCAGVHRPR